MSHSGVTGRQAPPSPYPTSLRSATLSRFAGEGSHIQIRHAQRIVLDELAARLDHVAHQFHENVVGLVDLGALVIR